MSTAVSATGAVSSSSMELVNNGKLVYACRDPFPKHLERYEAHRCNWLTKHRTRYAPQSYRQGKYNPISIGFSLITIFWR